MTKTLVEILLVGYNLLKEFQTLVGLFVFIGGIIGFMKPMISSIKKSIGKDLSLLDKKIDQLRPKDKVMASCVFSQNGNKMFSNWLLNDTRSADAFWKPEVTKVFQEHNVSSGLSATERGTSCIVSLFKADSNFQKVYSNNSYDFYVICVQFKGDFEINQKINFNYSPNLIDITKIMS